MSGDESVSVLAEAEADAGAVFEETGSGPSGENSSNSACSFHPQPQHAFGDAQSSSSASDGNSTALDKYRAYAENKDEEVTLDEHSASGTMETLQTILSEQSMDTLDAEDAVMDALSAIDHYAKKYGMTRREMLMAAKWANMRQNGEDSSDNSGGSKQTNDSKSSSDCKTYKSKTSIISRTKVDHDTSGVELSASFSFSTVGSVDSNAKYGTDEGPWSGAMGHQSAHNYDCTTAGFSIIADAADAQMGKDGMVDHVDKVLETMERLLGDEPLYIEKMLEKNFTCNDTNSHATAQTDDLTVKTSSSARDGGVGTSYDDYLVEDEYTLSTASVDDDLSTIKDVLGIKHFRMNPPRMQLSCFNPRLAVAVGDEEEGYGNPVIVQDAIRDADFDVAPTQLYKCIQSRDWGACVARSEAHPLEAQTWVFRQEHNPEALTTTIRWRILPLHAACIFRAPPSVINALLKAYPDSVLMKDDQSKLPLHVACHAGCDGDVIIALLKAYPHALEVRDLKGRLPIEVAESSPAENQASVAEAIKDFGMLMEKEKQKKKKGRLPRRKRFSRKQVA